MLNAKERDALIDKRDDLSNEEKRVLKMSLRANESERPRQYISVIHNGEETKFFPGDTIFI